METGDILNELSGLILDEQSRLTLLEVSRACAVHAEKIIELVEEGVLAPIEGESELCFSGVHMRRARVAIRLQSDLGVNLAGAALALQLLDELETLRSRIRAMEVE